MEDHKKTAEAIREQMVQHDPNEGNLMALKFTPDGEVPIVRRNGRDVEESFPAEEYKGRPKGWKLEHSEAMFKLNLAINEVLALKNRQIPLLREEAIAMDVPKRMLKELERFGYVRQRIIKILDSLKSNKSAGGRAVVYFLPQGKAFMADILKRNQERKKENEKDTSIRNES